MIRNAFIYKYRINFYMNKSSNSRFESSNLIFESSNSRFERR